MVKTLLKHNTLLSIIINMTLERYRKNLLPVSLEVFGDLSFNLFLSKNSLKTEKKTYLLLAIVTDKIHARIKLYRCQNKIFQ